MNNRRRSKLKKADKLLSEALSVVSNVLDEESDCFDNVPDSLQGTENYEKMEDAIDYLGDCVEQIEAAMGSISMAV